MIWHHDSNFSLQDWVFAKWWKETKCYDSSYTSSLITMLMTMLMTILRAIVDRLSLEHKLVLKSILFKVSLCSSESYK